MIADAPQLFCLGVFATVVDRQVKGQSDAVKLIREWCGDGIADQTDDEVCFSAFKIVVYVHAMGLGEGVIPAAEDSGSPYWYSMIKSVGNLPPDHESMMDMGVTPPMVGAAIRSSKKTLEADNAQRQLVFCFVCVSLLGAMLWPTLLWDSYNSREKSLLHWFLYAFVRVFPPFAVVVLQLFCIRKGKFAELWKDLTTTVLWTVGWTFVTLVVVGGVLPYVEGEGKMSEYWLDLTDAGFSLLAAMPVVIWIVGRADEVRRGL